MRLTKDEYAALLARGNLPPQPAAVAVPVQRHVAKTIMSLPPIHYRQVTLPSSETLGRVTLTLPWAPSVNRSLTYGNRRRMVARKVIWAYREAVCHAVDVQWPPTLFRPLNGRLSLQIVFSPSTRRRFDIDNPIKVIWDSLATDGYVSLHPRASVYFDDRQIDHYEVTRGPVIAGPAVVTIHITPFP